MIGPELWEGLLASWDYFVYLAIILVPLFIGASFLVGLTQAYFPPERVERMLRNRDGGSGNVAAAGFGAVTPFCSCSTVPILAGLLQAGSPLGLSFSFLLASPLVNWIAVILLLGLFGVEVTVLYVTVAFIAAVAAGLLIGRFDLEGHIKDIEFTAGGERTAVTDGGMTACCGEIATTNTHRARVTDAARDAWSFFTDMFPYLLLGMIVGALMYGIVPMAWLQTILGPGNPIAVPLAAIVGAPIYVSMEAMLPIAASFATQGIPIGTVLAFVVGSAGVSIPNLIMLNKLFDRTLLVVYSGAVVGVAIIMGIISNILVA
jgi:uncharacterized membrane protein YraQ (UPF0718 family)